MDDDDLVNKALDNHDGVGQEPVEGEPDIIGQNWIHSTGVVKEIFCLQYSSLTV